MKAHLLGGPLDGLNVPIGHDTSGWADQDTRSIYTFSPEATLRLKKVTFIHTTLEHDILTPS